VIIVKVNKVLVLALAGLILAVVAIGNASATDVKYSLIQSQLSGSGSSVSASWVTTDPTESKTIAYNNTGNILCRNYYQNSADRGTVHAYWVRDIFNANGIIAPDFDYNWAIDVEQGQTLWVGQQAPLVASKPTGSYKFEQMHLYHNQFYSEVWNPNPFTQKGLVITT
jgi:hypothetical protein